MGGRGGSRRRLEAGSFGALSRRLRDMSRVHRALGVAVTVAVGGLVLLSGCGGKNESTTDLLAAGGGPCA
jgi:hypothetical protein